MNTLSTKPPPHGWEPDPMTVNKDAEAWAHFNYRNPLKGEEEEE